MFTVLGRGLQLAGTAAVIGVAGYWSVRLATAERLSTASSLSQRQRATQLVPGDSRNWIRLAELQQYLVRHGTPDPAAAMHRAMVAIGDIVHAQATFMGYADCFALLGVVLLGALGAIAMLQKGATTAGGAH